MSTLTNQLGQILNKLCVMIALLSIATAIVSGVGFHNSDVVNFCGYSILGSIAGIVISSALECE